MKKALSIAVASILLGGVAVAPAWAVDPDDSVRAWGRWEKLGAPAAGPEVNNDPALLAEDGLVLRPEDGGALSPQVITPEDPDPVDPDPIDPDPIDPDPVDPDPVDPDPVDPIDPPILIPGTGTQPPGGPVSRPPRGAPI